MLRLLYTWAQNNAAYKELKDDIKYISTINQLSKIYTKSNKATATLTDASWNNEEINNKEKLELITDIMMGKVI